MILDIVGAYNTVEQLEEVKIRHLFCLVSSVLSRIEMFTFTFTIFNDAYRHDVQDKVCPFKQLMRWQQRDTGLDWSPITLATLSGVNLAPILADAGADPEGLVGRGRV